MMLTRAIRCTVVLLVLTLTPLLPVRAQGATVPEGTEIFLRLGRELDSSKLREEERFYGEVAVPVTVDDQIVIPAGAQILGRIVALGEKAGELRVGLDCQTLILPGNRRFDLTGGLTSKEGEVPEEDEDEDESLAASAEGAVRKGVDALFGLFGKGSQVMEKDSVVTVTLARDLEIPEL